MKLSFIGLGAMGAPMAQNLLKAGYDLTVFNRSKSKTDSMEQLGAKVADTPAQAASAGDVAITMLSNDQALEDVVFGNDGILGGLAQGGIHISMSTISIGMARKLEEAHGKKRQYYISAPVMGRPDAAKNALLRILMAGDEAAQQKVTPVMQALGQQVFSFGKESWHGNAVKIGMNFLLASMLESLAESQTLMDRLGIDPAGFMDVANAVFASPVYQNYGSIMLNKQFDPPGFRLKLGAKDVGLALDAAKLAGMELPLGELLEQSHGQGIADGNGDRDWTSLVLNYTAK